MGAYYKYPTLNGICNSCAGCNLLEDINFKGKYKCNNYVRLIPPGVQSSITKINKTLGVSGEQIKL